MKVLTLWGKEKARLVNAAKTKKTEYIFAIDNISDAISFMTVILVFFHYGLYSKNWRLELRYSSVYHFMIRECRPDLDKAINFNYLF